MKIWQLNFEVDKFDNLIPIKKFTADEIQSFDGRKHLDNWEPIRVERMAPEKGLDLSDAPGFTIPVFGENALAMLYPIIKNSIEPLELLFEDKKYYGINVVSVLDVIDYSKSKYRMYSDGNRIMAFQKYVFKQTLDIKTYNIFKIIDEPTRRAFVTDKFKMLVEENKLTGFIFKLVWDSEDE